MGTPLPDGLLPISTVARELGVHINTVREWADRGAIAHIVTPGGHRRFRREDVEAFLKSQDPAA